MRFLLDVYPNPPLEKVDMFGSTKSQRGIYLALRFAYDLSQRWICLAPRSLKGGILRFAYDLSQCGYVWLHLF